MAPRFQNRGGFAPIELPIVLFILLVLGLAISLIARWLTGEDHWTTWIPAALCGSPCMLFAGMILWMRLRDR